MWVNCATSVSRNHPHITIFSIWSSEITSYFSCIQFYPVAFIHHTSARLIFWNKNVNLTLLHSCHKLHNSFPVQSRSYPNSWPWLLSTLFWPLKHFRLTFHHLPPCSLRSLAFIASLEHVSSFLPESVFGLVLLSVASKKEGKTATQLLWLSVYQWKEENIKWVSR